MSFIGKMSLLLTANYGQLDAALTAVQRRAAQAGSAVGNIGTTANASLSGTPSILGRIASAMMSITGGAQGVSTAIMQIGEAIKDVAHEQSKLQKQPQTVRLPSILPALTVGAAGGAVAFKALHPVLAVQAKQAAQQAAAQAATFFPTPTRRAINAERRTIANETQRERELAAAKAAFLQDQIMYGKRGIGVKSAAAHLAVFRRPPAEPPTIRDQALVESIMRMRHLEAQQATWHPPMAPMDSRDAALLTLRRNAAIKQAMQTSAMRRTLQQQKLVSKALGKTGGLDEWADRLTPKIPVNPSIVDNVAVQHAALIAANQKRKAAQGALLLEETILDFRQRLAVPAAAAHAAARQALGLQVGTRNIARMNAGAAAQQMQQTLAENTAAQARVAGLDPVGVRGNKGIRKGETKQGLLNDALAKQAAFDVAWGQSAAANQALAAAQGQLSNLATQVVSTGQTSKVMAQNLAAAHQRVQQATVLAGISQQALATAQQNYQGSLGQLAQAQAQAALQHAQALEATKARLLAGQSPEMLSRVRMRGAWQAKQLEEPLTAAQYAKKVAIGQEQMIYAARIKELAGLHGKEGAAAASGGLALKVAHARGPLDEMLAKAAASAKVDQQLMATIKDIERRPVVAAKRFQRAWMDAQEAKPEFRPLLEERAQRLREEHRQIRAGATTASALLASKGTPGVPAVGAGPAEAAAPAAGMGWGGMLGIGAAVIGLGKVVAVGVPFEASMARVKALSGATGETFQELSSHAVEMGRTTMFSANEAARGMAELAGAGFSAKETMELIRPAMNAATAGGTELSTAINIAGAMSRAFGLSMEETKRAMDVMNFAGKRSGAGFEQFSEGMKYSMGVSHAAGKSIEETAAALAMLNRAGLQGSVSGTALRNMLKKTADSSAEARAVMTSLGLKFVDDQGKAKDFGQVLRELNTALKPYGAGTKLEYISKMFEIRAGTGFLTLLEQADQYDKMLSDIKTKSQGFGQMVTDMQMDTVAGSWKKFKGSIDAVALSLFNLTSGPLKITLDALTLLGNALGSKEAKGGTGFLGGALAGAGLGLLLKYSVGFIPVVGPFLKAIQAVKLLALGGGMFGFIGSSGGSRKSAAVFNPLAQGVADSEAYMKKIKDAGSIGGIGGDAQSLIDMGKALKETADAMRDYAATTKASIAIQSRWVEAQTGGFTQARISGQEWLKENKGAINELPKIQAERAKKTLEKNRLERMEAVYAPHDLLVGQQKQLTDIENLGQIGVNPFEKLVWGGTEETKNAKLLNRLIAGPTVRDAHQAFKNFPTAALDPERWHRFVPPEFKATEEEKDKPYKLAAPLKYPGFGSTMTELLKLEKEAAYLQQMEEFQIASGKLAPGTKRLNPDKTPFNPYAAAFKRTELEEYGIQHKNTILGMLREFPEMRGAMADLRQSKALEGQIKAMEEMGTKADVIAKLRQELEKLNEAERNAIGFKNRAEEMRELQDVFERTRGLQENARRKPGDAFYTPGMPSKDERLREELVWREQHRLELQKTLPVIRDLAKLRERLNLAEGVESQVVKDSLGKQIKELEKNLPYLIGLQTYEDQLKRMEQMRADTRTPIETYTAATSGYMDTLKMPQALLNSYEFTQKQLTDTMNDKDQGPAQTWALQLKEVVRQMKSATSEWDDFERAVRKAGKAMDDALGASRLPPALLEGSAAAVSRINQYAAENDPNRATMTAIRDVLERAAGVWQRQKEKLDEIEVNTRATADSMPGATSPFPRDVLNK